MAHHFELEIFVWARRWKCDDFQGVIWRIDLEIAIVQNCRQCQRDLRFGKIAAQTAVRPQAKGSKRTRLPMLCAVG